MTKISLFDANNNQFGNSLTEDLKFNENYSIDFIDLIGKHEGYYLKISYKNATNDDQQFIYLDIPNFKNLDLKTLEVKNVSVKQGGYKKAQIKFDMNEISKDENDKREIKVTKL